MQSYDSYLAKVQFESIGIADLTVEKMNRLKEQQGVLICEEGKKKTAIMHSFEAKIKHFTLEIREIPNEFIAINEKGITFWEGTAESVIEVVQPDYIYDEEVEKYRAWLASQKDSEK